MGLVVLTDRPGWQLASDSKVVEPEDVMAVEEASQLMRSVELYAARLLRSALKVYEHRATEGFKSGENKAEQVVSSRLSELEAARASLIDVLRPSLTDLLLEALAKLAHGVPRERLYASALVALEEAWRDARWAQLRVHPQDVAAAQTAIDEIVASSPHAVHIGVVGDESISPTACYFESDLGFADAGLDVQLASLREAFSSGLAAWADEPGDGPGLEDALPSAQAA
jgi:type III secretion protein L